MPLTLLLDLDDTLLDTHLAEFVPAYFQALAKHLEPWVSPAEMLPALMAGTQRMLQNIDPSLTLQEAFEQEFYARLGIDKAQLHGAIEEFYEHAFGLLGGLTRQRPGARELVDWVLARGDRLALATDPLFPRKATYERVRWAGLDPNDMELISSYETFHYTKSHPAYYAELLGRLGWPDGPVLMVGNDEERDLARAQELGLLTYQVDSAAAPVPASRSTTRLSPRAVGRGTLAELREWLGLVDPGSLEPALDHPDAILSILRSTPAVLHGLTFGLSDPAWRHQPAPDDWAMLEIVSHLRDTEREVHRVQIHTLLDEPQPFVPRPDVGVWAKQRNYLNDDPGQSLRDFTFARIVTLDELEGLSEQIWARPARHAIFGPTSFREVIGFMAEHDRLHIQQAWQTFHASA